MRVSGPILRVIRDDGHLTNPNFTVHYYFFPCYDSSMDWNLNDLICGLSALSSRHIPRAYHDFGTPNPAFKVDKLWLKTVLSLILR